MAETDTDTTTTDTTATEGAATDATGAASTTSETTTETSATTVASWRDGLDGELKEFADRYADPKSVVEAALKFRKDNSSMVRVPGKDATPEQVAAFRNAIGAPKTAAEYKFELPAGQEVTDSDKAIQAKIAEVFHANNVPAVAAQAISKVVNELVANIDAEKDRVALRFREQGEAALRKEWGADFDKTLPLKNLALKEFGTPALVDFLNNTHINGGKLGDHHDIIRFFAMVGLKMNEGGLEEAVTVDQAQSAAEEMAQILRDNPPMSEKYKTPAIQRRMAELSAKVDAAKRAAA